MTALSVRNLTKRYPSFTLDGVCFAVEEGRVCGLVGANGAGKSTLLKGILGLISAEGSAKIFGYPAVSREAKTLVGYSGGGFRCYPQTKLKRIAAVTASFYERWDQAMFERLCGRFGLSPEKKTSECSEGMRVKFSLALAVSHGARLLVLDEPTSGLDPLSREEFCDCILALVREEGVSVLFSTHVTSDLARIADDVVLLSNGKVLTNEPLSALKERYLLAHVGDRSGSARRLIGAKEVKEGFEGLILQKDRSESVSLRAPTLDEIIIHLECERRSSCSRN
jgi:ABC-2 type transport system ATP-binding protein